MTIMTWIWSFVMEGRCWIYATNFRREVHCGRVSFFLPPVSSSNSKLLSFTDANCPRRGHSSWEFRSVQTIWLNWTCYLNSDFMLFLFCRQPKSQSYRSSQRHWYSEGIQGRSNKVQLILYAFIPATSFKATFLAHHPMQATRTGTSSILKYQWGVSMWSCDQLYILFYKSQVLINSPGRFGLLPWEEPHDLGRCYVSKGPNYVPEDPWTTIYRGLAGDSALFPSTIWSSPSLERGERKEHTYGEPNGGPKWSGRTRTGILNTEM